VIQEDHPNRDDPIRDDYLIGDAATTSPFLTGAATSGLVAASPATTPAPAPPGSPDADGGPVTTPPDEQGMPAGSDPDGTLVPCRICGRPLSQPRIDYGRTTCRDHYHLEAEAEHAMSSAAPPTAPGRDHPEESHSATATIHTSSRNYLAVSMDDHMDPLLAPFGRFR